LLIGAPLLILPFGAWSEPNRSIRAWRLYPSAQLVCYLVTPLSAGYAVINARFLLVPAAASIAVLGAAISTWTLARQRIAVSLALLLSLVFSVALGSGITAVPLPPAASALVLVLPVVVLLYRRPRGLILSTRLAGVAVATPVLIGVVLAGPLASHYDHGRGVLPFEAAAHYLRPTDRTIDVVGICEIYPFYGPDVDRHVLFLSDGGGFDPPFATGFSAWLRELFRHHATAIVVERSPEVCFGLRPPPEQAWILDHPNIFRLTRSVQGVSIYRL
jgi:hypothetical protein